MLTLFDVPLSPYAQKVKLALLEKGLAFETRIPDLDAPEPAFRAASPRLEVPVLLDGDASIFDSSIILEYIEDRWPEPALRPQAPMERARVRMLQELCDSVYDAAVWGAAEVSVFKRAEGVLAEQLLSRARAQLAGLNARLERELAAREHFNGESFGLGDIIVYPFVNGAAALGFKPVAGSRLEGWLKRTRKRPSADRVKQDILDNLAHFMQRPQAIADGKSRRQYRDHRLDWMMRSGGAEIVQRGMQVNNVRFTLEIE